MLREALRKNQHLLKEADLKAEEMQAIQDNLDRLKEVIVPPLKAMPADVVKGNGRFVGSQPSLKRHLSNG
jgi:hypothetical protein